jgi:hypothetical protein
VASQPAALLCFSTQVRLAGWGEALARHVWQQAVQNCHVCSWCAACLLLLLQASTAEQRLQHWKRLWMLQQVLCVLVCSSQSLSCVACTH